jgi:hypothetical protein
MWSTLLRGMGLTWDFKGLGLMVHVHSIGSHSTAEGKIKC